MQFITMGVIGGSYIIFFYSTSYLHIFLVLFILSFLYLNINYILLIFRLIISMDKSLIEKYKVSKKYLDGINSL